MIFGTHGQTARMPNLTLELGGGIEIKKVETYKYPGVKLDTRLIFSKHVAYMKEKTYFKVKLPGRLSYTLEMPTLLLLYKCLILLIFDFTDIIYHSLNYTDAVAL